jgi:hypothetical protein
VPDRESGDGRKRHSGGLREYGPCNACRLACLRPADGRASPRGRHPNPGALAVPRPSSRRAVPVTPFGGGRRRAPVRRCPPLRCPPLRCARRRRRCRCLPGRRAAPPARVACRVAGLARQGRIRLADGVAPAHDGAVLIRRETVSDIAAVAALTTAAFARPVGVPARPAPLSVGTLHALPLLGLFNGSGPPLYWAGTEIIRALPRNASSVCPKGPPTPRRTSGFGIAPVQSWFS